MANKPAKAKANKTKTKPAQPVVKARKAVKVAKKPVKSVQSGTTKADKDGTVRNKEGKAMFRRMEPVAPAPEVKKERTKAVYKSVQQLNRNTTGTQGALLRYPADRWGLTKDIKTAMTKLASRIGGSEPKYALAKEVLAILNEHFEAKYKADVEYRAKLAERNTETKDTESK